MNPISKYVVSSALDYGTAALAAASLGSQAGSGYGWALFSTLCLYIARTDYKQ